MAIYHLTTKNIGRSSGRSATAAAAYRAAEKITDARQGLTFNYQARTQSVDHSEILSPSVAPDFVRNRSHLWNAVEASEKRKDARVAREVEVALPRELSLAQNIELTRDFVKRSFVARGMVADVCVHDAQGDNPHAHIMLTTRHLRADGFGQKNRDWNKDELLEEWRKEWELVCNTHLEKHNLKERIDHRSLEAQGVDRLPQQHIGVAATGFERRTGGISDKRLRDEMRQLSLSAVSRMQETRKQHQLELVQKQEQAREAQQNKPSRGYERGM
ncbi:MAG: MobQ family relaxase [Saezia sp.]